MTPPFSKGHSQQRGFAPSIITAMAGHTKLKMVKSRTDVPALFNPLKTERIPSSSRAVNTFHLGYKNQSVYSVSDTSRCLISDKYKTHKYSVGRAYSC